MGDSDCLIVVQEETNYAQMNKHYICFYIPLKKNNNCQHPNSKYKRKTNKLQ